MIPLFRIVEREWIESLAARLIESDTKMVLATRKWWKECASLMRP